MSRAYFLAGGIGLLAIAILLIHLAFHSTSATASVNTASAPSTPPMLKWISSQVNAKLPKMIDAETRLDRTDAGPGEVFNEYYTLVSHASAEFNPRRMHALMRQSILDKGCASKQVRKILDMGVTLNYVYQGNDGVEVTRVTVLPSDCGVVPH